MRVLYVDDDRINTLLFVEACRLASDVEVETASSGEDALALARSWLPDMLVIDLHLPDTDGYALLPQLRACLGDPLRPAFLCTADELDWVDAKARAVGFDGCWTKPVDLQLILRELALRSAAPGAGG